MRARGKVLRAPNSAPGLVMIEGQQFWFSCDSAWKSEIAPEPGLVVSVDLDRELQVVAVTPVPEAQLHRESIEEGFSERDDRRTGFLRNLWAKLLKRCRR